MMSKNSIVPFLKDYLIKFLTRPFLLDTNDFSHILIGVFPPFWLPNLNFGGIPKDTKKPANSQHFVHELVG